MYTKGRMTKSIILIRCLSACLSVRLTVMPPAHWFLYPILIKNLKNLHIACYHSANIFQFFGGLFMCAKYYLWRPGIGVSVTQRHCVFKPIKWYTKSRTTKSIPGLYDIIGFSCSFNQFRITTGKCHLLKIKEERKELH